MNVSELKARADKLTSIIGNCERDLAAARTELQEVQAEIRKKTAPKPKPTISEHALLRFIERVLGFDVESIRRRVMTEGVVSAMEKGATAVTIEGVRFIVRNNTIVTTVDKPDRKKMQKQGRRPEPVDGGTA